MSTPRVFISYSRNDSDWARKLAEALRKQDVDVWLDAWEVSPGEPWQEALETGLRSSDAVVVLVSNSVAHSPHVLFELGAALGTGKKLIPVLSEDLDSSTAIPFPLRTRRYLMKRSPDETAEEVATAIKTIRTRVRHSACEPLFPPLFPRHNRQFRY
jgi:hypothetical protein